MQHACFDICERSGAPVNSAGSCTRCAPEMISSPRMNTSKELLYRASSGSGIV